MPKTTSWTTVKVTLRKSPIACKPDHKATVQALGLRKISQSKEFSKDSFNACIQGMVEKINYLLKVEYI
ncbi:MAG: 50S ribosomal protein L30 [Gammaproteobacteria bacterium]